MSEALVDYYAGRAQNYDEIYEIPAVQDDLDAVERIARDQFRGHDLLEVACGTGYWTTVFARISNSVVGVDANDETITVAREKEFPGEDVHFVCGDAYRLPLSETFTAGFAGFWWSHVPLGRRADFMESFHGALEDGAPVCMFDNNLVEGEVTPDYSDDAGNTYQTRELADGSRHEVLKNFPSETDLRESLEPYATDVEYHDFGFFWCVTYALDDSAEYYSQSE